jgi:hypothetical protein
MVSSQIFFASSLQAFPCETIAHALHFYISNTTWSIVYLSAEDGKIWNIKRHKSQTAAVKLLISYVNILHLLFVSAKI